MIYEPAAEAPAATETVTIAALIAAVVANIAI
jgi:hypothetical protein